MHAGGQEFDPPHLHHRRAAGGTAAYLKQTERGKLDKRRAEKNSRVEVRKVIEKSARTKTANEQIMIEHTLYCLS